MQRASQPACTDALYSGSSPLKLQSPSLKLLSPPRGLTILDARLETER